MNRKQYIKFALIYYPLSFVAVFAWAILAILGGKPEYNNFLVIIGISIILYSVYTRLKYGNRRLQYLSKSKWWLIFSLCNIKELVIHTNKGFFVERK